MYLSYPGFNVDKKEHKTACPSGQNVTPGVASDMNSNPLKSASHSQSHTSTGARVIMTMGRPTSHTPYCNIDISYLNCCQFQQPERQEKAILRCTRLPSPLQFQDNRVSSLSPCRLSSRDDKRDVTDSLGLTAGQSDMQWRGYEPTVKGIRH